MFQVECYAPKATLLIVIIHGQQVMSMRYFPIFSMNGWTALVQGVELLKFTKPAIYIEINQTVDDSQTSRQERPIIIDM